MQPEPGPEDVVATSQQDTNDSVAPSQTMLSIATPTSSESLTLNPIKAHSADPDHRDSRHSSVQPTPPNLDPVELPALKTLNLTPSLDQGPSISPHPTNGKNEKLDVAVVARNVVNAMMKSMNSSQRLRSQAWDFGAAMDEQRQSELSDRNNQMIRHILMAALSHVPDSYPSDTGSGASPGSPVAAEKERQGLNAEKKNLIQCEKCPTQTRLRCEMRYVLFTWTL